MRTHTLILMMVAASPLYAQQTQPEAAPPFEDIVYVHAEALGLQENGEIRIVPGLGKLPVRGSLFKQTPIPVLPPASIPQPNGNIQVQQAIEKITPGTREVLIMDLDSVLLASAAKSLQGNGEDETTRKLIGGLKSIQIRAWEIEGGVFQYYTARLQPIRDLLKASPQWVRYAAHASAQSEMELWSGRSGNTPTGVLLLSLTGKQVFIMHVVGDLRPDQLVFLSGLLGIPNFNLPLGRN